MSHKSGAHHTDANIQVQTAAVRHRFSVPIPGVSDREYYMNQVGHVELPIPDAME